MTAFTYRAARSGSIVVGLGLAIAVETLVLHLWLGARHPAVAWTLTLASVATLVWLGADYAALGAGAVRLDDDDLDLRVGRRGAVKVPRTAVRAVVRPTWRDLPVAGSPEARDYLNLTKPATPNVLVSFVEPVTVRLPGGVTRRARRIALRLDDPDALVAALADRAPPTAPHA